MIVNRDVWRALAYIARMSDATDMYGVKWSGFAIVTRRRRSDPARTIYGAVKLGWNRGA